jgi:parallel beta-helix repeat protein
LNLISNNQVVNNIGTGILIYSDFNNVVTDNNISSNGENGITIRSADWNVINNNFISSNRKNGIEIRYSKNNLIKDNILINNEIGILIKRSDWTSITNNTMLRDGLMITEGRHTWDTHEIDVSNTVNGKPLYYWKNQIGGTIPNDAGQVILADCSDVTIENQVITNTSIAISIGYSINCTVSHNSLSNNRYGIYHVNSQDTNITRNSVSNNYYGIYLDHGRNRRNPINISGNTAWENTYGFYLYRSHYNRIIANNITDNEYGILMEQSSSNILHHNNIIDNAVQFNSTSGGNDWDNIGGEEGNFWSDYTGSDIDGDGVGDTQVPHLDVDEFPLTEPADITKEYEVNGLFEDPVFDGGEPYRPSPLAMALIMIVLVVLIILLTKPARKKKKEDEPPPLGWDMHGFGLGTTPPSEVSEHKGEDESVGETNSEIEEPPKSDELPQIDKDQ